MMFSQTTLKFLENAGWFPGRSVSFTGAKALLEDKGFSLSLPAEMVLAEFGGLLVKHPHWAGPRDKLDDNFHFDVPKALTRWMLGWIGEYSAMVGEELCPIGEAYRGNMIMCAGPSGRIYGGFDDTFVLFGETTELAIENLCSGAKPIDLSHLGETAQ